MRPGVDRGRVPAPGAQLVAAGEDAVAAGDDFFGIDVPDRGGGEYGGAEGGHFLAQFVHRSARPAGEEAVELGGIIEHVGVEGVQHFRAEGVDHGRIAVRRQAAAGVDGVEGAGQGRAADKGPGPVTEQVGRHPHTHGPGDQVDVPVAGKGLQVQRLQLAVVVHQNDIAAAGGQKTKRFRVHAPAAEEEQAVRVVGALQPGRLHGFSPGRRGSRRPAAPAGPSPWPRSGKGAGAKSRPVRWAGAPP